jgi:hypothetical protein
VIWLSLAILLSTFALLSLVWWALRQWTAVQLQKLVLDETQANLNHQRETQTLRIWTLMLSNAEGVAVTAADSAPPDVVVVPDDDENYDPMVLVDDDDEEAKWLMGVLNIDNDG